ncbi:hypothetical protein NMY22_g390 [Coprinellus aureogranulatus]|nr:hypothetical protein NMY22_g390 [Coprinellus aureogranulatus]
MSADYCVDYYPSVCDGYSRLVRAHLSMSAAGNPSCQLAPSHLQCLAQMAITAQPDDVALHSAISAVPAILHRVTCKKVADLDKRQQRAYKSAQDHVTIFLDDVERSKSNSPWKQGSHDEETKGGWRILAELMVRLLSSQCKGMESEPWTPNEGAVALSVSKSEPYPQWKSREEAEIASFVQDLIRVLQYILFFAQVVEDPTLPEERIAPSTITGGEIEGPSIFFSVEPETCHFALEIKGEGDGKTGDHHIQQVYKHLTSATSFSDRPEHLRVTECFNPNHPVSALIDDVNALLKDPEVGPQQKAHATAIQLSAFMLQSSSRTVLVTNGTYDALLCRGTVGQEDCDLYLSLFSNDRPQAGSDAVDTRPLVNCLAYLVDRLMMPFKTHLFFHPAVGGRVPGLDVLPPMEAAKSAVSQGSRRGLQESAVELAVLVITHLFQPTFSLDLVDGRPALGISISRVLRLALKIDLCVVSNCSRQGVILRSASGAIYVKVYGDEEAFQSETDSLRALSKTAPIPRLLGCGTTGGGDKFAVHTGVGQPVAEDLTEGEAQVFFDTVLKPIHDRGYHHHDLHPGNITRDSRGAFHLIDFGDATDNCPDPTECSDAAWITEHGVYSEQEPPFSLCVYM